MAVMTDVVIKLEADRR